MSASVVAIDSGTTALKVGVFDVDRGLVALERRDHGLERPAPGRCEQRIDETTEALVACLRDLGVRVNLRTVTALAVSGQRGTVVALDRAGEPLSDYVSWMDRRGMAWLDVTAERVGEEAYYRTAGHPIVPVTGISKILALLHGSEPSARAAVIGPQQTHLLSWLGSDGLVCDRSTGSFHFPMTPDSEDWSDEIANALDVPLARLPRLVDSTDVVGELRQAVADATGLPAGIPIVAGGGDGQCAGAGSGTTDAGDALVNIGTAAGVLVPLDRPLRDPRRILNCAAYVVPGTWEMEGHTQASGIAVDWFREQLGALDYETVVALAGAASPGAAGLRFVPTFNGATAPVVEDRLGAAFVGLRLDHERRHLARAVLEGVCLEIATLLDAVQVVAGEVSTLRVSGGATRSATWMQILADVLARPVRIVDPSEAALVGAAMCAAVGAGAYSDMRSAAASLTHEAAMFTPDPSLEACHADLRASYTLALEGLVSIARGTASGRDDR